MADTELQARSSGGIYLSDFSKDGMTNVKLKLGLAELILQALILILLV